MSEPHGEAPLSSSPTGDAGPGGTASRGPARILVIEDDDPIRRMVATALRGDGYVVIEACHGGEALDRLSASESWPGTPAPSSAAMVDLILLDMKMPVMDGWAFARAYAALPGPHAPIVVITAAADAAQRADEIGAVGYLAKPFRLASLYASVARALGRAAA
jgi:two-component system, chemotaxis family, chemotaxis protein CheY